MHAQASIDGTDQDLSGDADRTASAQSPIGFADFTVSVAALVAALEDCPAWNLHTPRRDAYAHMAMSDIWVRFNAWKNYRGDLARFNDEHESVWYPVSWQVPEIRLAVNDVMAQLPESELGGVLITRIPPGGEIAPHVDEGWHAEYYKAKYAVQLKGTAEQSFNFDGFSLSPLPGQVFWFDNSRQHWVDNPSEDERMTMIVCTREIH
jgi:hypothetical protein